MLDLRITSPSPVGPPVSAGRKIPWFSVALALLALFGFVVAAPFLAFSFGAVALELRAFRNSSDSMCPTLCANDRILASMNAYRRAGPQRGDVILHRVPAVSAPYVKRVIGVAGDTISPGPHNVILVNGQPLASPRICGKPTFAENSGGESPAFESVKVPAGSFFVIGIILRTAMTAAFTA